MTDQDAEQEELEVLEFAEDIEQRQTGPYEVDGRPIGAFEMHALCKLHQHRRAVMFEERGVCCDTGPTSTAGCKFGGPCHVLLHAQQLRKEHEIDGQTTR